MSEDNSENKLPVPPDDGQSLQAPIEQIQEAIKDLPEPQRQRVQHIIQEFLSVSLVHGSSRPRLDPKTAEIVTASIDKDNEHKFQYLTQKQRDKAEADKRKDDFAVIQHNDRKKMLWPLMICAILVSVFCIMAGVYYSANGHDVLGASLLTAVVTGVFAYLAGLGTANFFKK